MNATYLRIMQKEESLAQEKNEGGPTLIKRDAPTGNRTQGKCLEGIYVTTTPSALLVLTMLHRVFLYYINNSL